MKTMEKIEIDNKKVIKTKPMIYKESSVNLKFLIVILAAVMMLGLSSCEKEEEKDCDYSSFTYCWENRLENYVREFEERSGEAMNEEKYLTCKIHYIQECGNEYGCR